MKYSNTSDFIVAVISICIRIFKSDMLLTDHSEGIKIPCLSVNIKTCYF